MLLKIYILPIWVILLAMVLGVVLWRLGAGWVPRRLWLTANGLLLPLCILGVLAATVLGREPGEQVIIWKPFAILALARENPEFYRSMLMNALLFFPLGLTASQLRPRRCPILFWAVGTVMLGCCLSIGVEWLQYTRCLGQAETDDVLCNTLGTLLGTLSLGQLPRCRGKRGTEG